MSKIGIRRVLDDNRERITLFVINFVIMTIFFGGLIRRSYNSDTTTFMVYTYDDIAVRIRDGRYLVAMFNWMLYEIGIKATDHIAIFVFLSLIVLAATATVLQRVFKPFLKSQNKIIVAAYYLSVELVFTNVLFIEYLMFPEISLFYAIGFYLATLGVYYCTENKKLWAVILIFAGACTYQMTSVYVAITIVFFYLIFHEAEFSKKAFMDELFAFIIPFGCGALNMGIATLVEIITTDYYFGKGYYEGEITDKISQIVECFALFLKNSMTLLPSLYIPGIVSIAALIVSVLIINKKQGMSGVLYYLGVVFSCTASVFAITFIQDGLTFPPRIAFNLYHVQGMMLVVAFALVDGELDWSASFSKDCVLKLGAYIVFAYIWIQMLFCSYIISGRFVSNALDKAYAQIILGKIDKYEQETGITVTKLNVTNDEYAPPYYDDARIHYGQINERIIGITTRSMFEAWFDRHFDAQDELPEDIYREYFEGRDWDRFDVDEQLVIVGDTAYLCVY